MDDSSPRDLPQPPLLEKGDPLARALLLAALVSERFRLKGYEPVVVGGSAIEFYTDGAYMSGDIDICWAGGKKPTPVERADVMSRQLGATGGSRSWKVGKMFVDLLGELESQAEEKMTMLETPQGSILLPPVEELLVERVFSARMWTPPNETDERCPRTLMAALLSGELQGDWKLVENLAMLSDYDCLEQVREMMDDVMRELEKQP
ncbi:hypothetical protein FEM03_01610 [Phragmitibacter flavus]|uniref:Nucleotidyl transferase AbiEii/AbiGii toxin family protein n=1 Tax=Phragmitibacter flavus TaxID=2576071 RepID=A0A5R8KKE0_9BACT|nr:hypothetical protein [Phragmitibacter flavus]TLD72794.1 hypothetical protein FEM03_01610 [Phragmitibacter flavus]